MELLGCGNRSALDDGGIHHLISGVQSDAVSTSSSSFTALLELPPSQAVQLLHSPLAPPPAAVAFPSDGGLIERAARFSVFSGGSPDTTAGPAPSNSSGGFPAVKCEPLVSDPTVEDNSAPPRLRPAKRKEREKKGNNNNNGSKKKSKNGAGKESSEEEAEKLPYVHVRARRGQATDSHSLAERARREKINARMKLLQELVPGCNKISGTALVLDEIINHVQSLQQQVEFLSMRLAAVNPSIDFNLDSLLAAENGSMVESNFSGMIMPLMWPELQFGGNRQHYQQQQQWPIDPLNQQVWVREEDSPNFVAPDLSYDSSGNSVSLRSNQVKMEL